MPSPQVDTGCSNHLLQNIYLAVLLSFRASRALPMEILSFTGDLARLFVLTRNKLSINYWPVLGMNQEDPHLLLLTISTHYISATKRVRDL